MSATYKEVGEWEKGGGVGWWAQVILQSQWDQLYAKGAVNGPQTTLQGKAGHLIAVMDNWEQFHTNATLLKPTKYCHSLFRTL